MLRVATLALVLVVSAFSWTAEAQTFRPPDPLSRPWSTAQMNLGPIYFAPTFEVRDVGVDNNVFNDPANPKDDVTGTLGLRSNVGLHFGEGLVLQVTQSSGYVYFRRYRSERSIASSLSAVLEYRTRIARPWIRWETSKSSARMGVEVDARAEHKTPTFDFGIDFNDMFRFGVSAAARRANLRYADDAVTSDAVNLGEVLDSQSDVYQGLVRYELSDLSDFLVGFDWTRDRFTNTPLRDNDSYFGYTGIRTKQGAAFVGSATLGFRQQKHNDPRIPDFKGITANVDVSVIPNEFLRVDLSGRRDLGYSYLAEYPFFIESGGGFNFSTRLSDHYDIAFTSRATWLNYDKTMSGTSDKRSERTVVLSIGPGYFVHGGDGMRIGVQFERAQRVSPMSGRGYVTNRITTSYRLSF